MAFLSYCHPTLYFLSGAIKLNQKLPLNNDNKITLFKIYWPHNKCPFIIYSPHLKLASQRSDKDDSLTLFSSVQSFLARHWRQSSQERGDISAQGHSFVPGHKLWGEQVLTHGPNHLSLSLPHKKRWSRPAAFTAWQHGHGKLCFKRDIRLSTVTPANKVLLVVNRRGPSSREKGDSLPARFLTGRGC